MPPAFRYGWKATPCGCHNLDAIQKITDTYAASIDYDATHLLSQSFFATVQNELHFAIHGRTAAEVIKGRADAAGPAWA